MDTIPFSGFGAAYDPGFWSSEERQAHVEFMREARLAFLRLYEFCWHEFEPEDGVFRFEHADEFLELLDKNGIRYILATPGATPPRWLTQKHPEVLAVGADGRPVSDEIRRHGCPSSPEFMRRVLKITELMAQRYGNRAGLLGWQIDNEVGHPFCYCENCRQGFVEWLKRKYSSIEEVNHVFGMMVWSHEYNSFEEVRIPNLDSMANPQLKFAYRQFTSEKWRMYIAAHLEILKKYSAAPITTNMMAPWHGYDHFPVGRELDVVGMDYYPYSFHGYMPYGTTSLEFNCAYTRAIAGGKAFWFLENQLHTSFHTRPEIFREWVWSEIGNGASLFNFFRLDIPPFGGEEMAYGLIGGSPWRSSFAEQFRAFGREMAELGPIFDHTVCEPAKCALAFSFESWRKTLDTALLDFPGTTRMLAYPQMLSRHVEGLSANGIRFDFADLKGDLRKYPCLILPHQLVMDDADIENVLNYAREGGTLLITAQTGVYDSNGRGYPPPFPPEKLRSAAGVEAGLYGKIPDDAGPVRFGHEVWTVDSFFDDLTVTAADVEILMECALGKERRPILTRRNFGKGKILYFGAFFRMEDAPGIYRELRHHLELTPEWWSNITGVRGYCRIQPGGTRRLEILQNLTEEPIEFHLPFPAVEKRTNETLSLCRIPPRETVVLQHGF